MYKSSLVTGKKNNNLVCGLKKGKQSQPIPQPDRGDVLLVLLLISNYGKALRSSNMSLIHGVTE